MPARIIDGKALAEAERQRTRDRVGVVTARGGSVALDAVIVDAGDNASRVYAANQARGCEALGISYRLHELPAGSSESQIIDAIERLNADDSVTAIMVHMPLPPAVDSDLVKSSIDPAKDVEGVNPANIGNVIYDRSSLAPCTALATVRLIEAAGVELRGKRAVVIGASATVGRPLAAMLMARDATVISCNRWTWGLEDLARTADVLVSAVGKPNLVTAEMVKPGAVVIDVGVNRVDDGKGGRRIVGDVVFDRVSQLAGWITPVPGGVGPMTVAMLLSNVVEAAEVAASDAIRVTGGR